MMLRKDPAARPADAREVEQMLTLAGMLQPDQAALQRLAARAEERRSAHEQRNHESEQLEKLGSSAQMAFEKIWADLVARAQEAVPDAEGVKQVDHWFLTVADGRLSVHLVAPSSSSSTLWLGLVAVQNLDQPTASVVANVRCYLRAGQPEWELPTFGHNALSTERPLLCPRQAAGLAGMGLAGPGVARRPSR